MLVMLALALGLSGCALCGVDQFQRLPESEPLQAPVVIDHPGVLEFEPTGFAFAEWYDNFQRVSAYRFDTAGLDVAFGYNDQSPKCLIVATFYVYPAPRMSFAGASPSTVASLQATWLGDEFARAMAEIEQVHPGLVTRSTEPSIGQVSDALVRGPSLTFAEADRLSELHLFVYKRQWFLKYRFTYLQRCEREAASRLDSLTRQLPWADAGQDAAAAGPQPVSMGGW